MFTNADNLKPNSITLSIGIFRPFPRRMTEAGDEASCLPGAGLEIQVQEIWKRRTLKLCCSREGAWPVPNLEAT